MFFESLKYPFKGEKSVNNIIIGSIIVVASILILPAFILAGYLARTVNNALNGEPAPEFKDFSGLFADGVKLVSIFIIYFVSVVVLMFPIAFLGSISDTLGLVSFWLYLPIFFLFYVGHPVILYFYGRNLEFRDAFKIKEVVAKIISWKYAKILLFFIVIQIAFTVLQILLFFTLLGIIAIPLTLFIELVIYAKLISSID